MAQVEGSDEPEARIADHGRANERSRAGRRIEPLESDPGAWLDFFRGWTSAPDPRAKLAELGLVPADVMRLQAHWSAQMALDAGLLRLAAERLAGPTRALPLLSVQSAEPNDEGTGEPPPMTVRDGAPRESRAVLPFVPPSGDGQPAAVLVHAAEGPPAGAHARPAGGFDTAEIQPLRIPPLPFARPPTAAAPVTAALPASPSSSAPASANIEPTDQAPSLSLEHYASLCAELAVLPGQAEQVFARYGLRDVRRRRQVDQWFQAHLRRDPRQYAAWQRLYAQYLAHWSSVVRRAGPPT